MTSIDKSISSKGSILVVDDTPANLHLLAEMLSRQGYKIRIATNGTQALASVRSSLPDLILLDIMMPHPDGYEVCSELKADELTRDIPIIFLSAKTEAIDKVKAFSLGGVDYITKPFEIEEVMARVENQLKISRLSKQLAEQNTWLAEEIRDRHRAENARRESEKKYRALVEASQDMIWSVDVEGRYTFVNPAVKQIYGYDPSEMIGRKFTDFITAEQAAKDIQAFERILNGESLIQYENTQIAKDGSLIYLLWNAITLQDERGNFVGTTGSATNISDRKRAEEALKLIVEGTASTTGREFFRSCVRYLAEVLQVRYAIVTEFANDPKTRARALAFWTGSEWNDDIEYNLAGTPCENVLKGTASCYPDNLQEIFPEDKDLVQLNAQSYWGIPLINSEGLVIGHLAVLDTKTMTCDPGKESILKIFAARAGAELERKRVEEELVASEKRLQVIISSNADGLIIVNKKGIVQFVNPAAGNLIGRQPEELVGQWFGIPIINEGIGEVDIIHPARGSITVEIRVVEIIWDGANAYLASLRDTTARKRAENETRLLLETTQAISRADSVKSALVGILRLICAAIAWDVAEAWLPSEDGTVLEYSPGWYGSYGAFEEFRRYSETLTFAAGVGLPGRVWSSGQPEWIEDVSSGEGRIFYRTQIAKEQGLKAGFGVPIVADDRVVAVLVFFKQTQSNINPRSLDLVNAVAAQLGALIQRKQAEAALRESQRRYQSLAEASPVCIFHTDADGNCLYVNQRWSDITGLSLELAVGTGWVNNLHPEDRSRVEAEWYEAALAKVPFKSEYRFLRPDGTIVWVIGQAVAEIGSDGEVTGYVGTITDISDRKQAEIELRSTRARLEYLLTYSPAIIFSAKPKGDYGATFMSPNVTAVFGYEAREFLEDSHFWATHVHPEDIGRVAANLPQLLSKGFYTHEYRFLHADGTYRWMYAQLRLVEDSAGNPVECVGYWVDISDRKQAEEDLRKSEATNRALLNAIPDMMIRCKVDGTCVDFKPAKDMIDLATPSSFVGKKAQEVLPPPLAERMLQANEQAILSNQIQLIEYQMSFGDVTCDYEARVVAVGRDEVIAIVRDISDRKQVERLLQESAEREKAIARVIQRMRQTLDIETIFSATTSELRQLLKCDRVALYRFNPDWSGKVVAESVAPGWIPLIEEQKNDPNLTDRSLEHEDCSVKTLEISHDEIADTYLQKTSGGAYIKGANCLSIQDIYSAGFPSCYVNLLERLQARAYVTVPIFCGDRLWGLLANYQNSGPRQWGEAEISIAIQIGSQLGVAVQQAELLAQTQRQSAALEKAAIAANAANRAKSEFLASMSHELRTPLNAILGFSQVMSRDKSLTQPQQENLGIINRAGEHLLDLINDILEMSKIEAGRTALNLGSIDLMKLLSDLEQMLKLRAQSKNLQLIFEIASDIPQYVQTDEGKLRQVLINILGNAIKFTQEGSVTLRAIAAKGNGEWGIGNGKSGMGNGNADFHPILARQSPIPNPQSPIPNPQFTITFEIEDTGPGIAPEEIDLLFQPFEQTETGRKSQQGTGLGLPISRKFVQLMGGDIRVRSTPRLGSVFAFDIQVNPAEAAEVETVQPPRKVIGLAPNQPEYRILVVDDRFESRLLLVTLLESLGFVVGEAENGREAITVWSSWEPHLIVMDMRMPVMDGYEATRQIKSTLQGQATGIIALTASAFEEERKIILSAGCDDFVRKPFREEVLLEKVSQHLGVVYVYEEEGGSPQEAKQKTGEISTDADLKGYLDQMPVEWVTQLYSAACNCSDDEILELIEEITAEQMPLAIALRNIANDFQFKKIIELISSEGAK